MRTGLATLLIALLYAAAVSQTTVAKPRLAPEQVVQQVRDYRMNNEDRIIREFRNAAGF